MSVNIHTYKRGISEKVKKDRSEIIKGIKEGTHSWVKKKKKEK